MQVQAVIAEAFGTAWNSMERQALAIYLDSATPAAQRQHCCNLIAVRLKVGIDDVEKRRQLALAMLGRTLH